MTTEESINQEIKQLKEKIEVLENQRKQLNWEDKCFKINGSSQEIFIRVHKLINKDIINVKVLCDTVIYESDSNTFSFAFNKELTFDILLLNKISLIEFRKNIKRIYDKLDEQI